MIRLKQRDFRREFLPTFEKLMHSPGLNQRVAYNLSKLSRPIKKAAGEAQAEFIALVKHYAVKDERGEIVPLPDQPGTFQIAPETQETWKKAVEEFEAKEVVIDRHPLMVIDLAQATLTPNDYLALEPLIKDMELVEDSTTPNMLGGSSA